MESNPTNAIPAPAPASGSATGSATGITASPGTLGTLPPVILALGAVLLAGFGWLHWDFLERSFRSGIKDPNWSHILVVPLISAYYIYLNRERLLARPAALCWWGVPIMVAGVFSYLWWIYPGRNDMFRGYSMIITIFGMVLFTQGFKRMGVLWFPIVYLVFAVKIPDSLWQQIAFVLQKIAAAGSVVMLTLFGELLDFELTSTGQDITMRYVEGGRFVEHSFSIAQACSGLRMLMAFCALGVALAFLWDRAWWQRLIMIAMAVPIALAVNIARVTTLGLLNLVNPEYAKGDFHIAVGMMMLVPAALLFMALGWALDKMLIVDEDELLAKREAQRAAAAKARGDGLHRAAPAGVLARDLVLGVAMMLSVGVTYVLVLNGASGVRAIESLSAGLSLALAVPAAAVAVGLFWIARRWTPGITAGLALVTGMVLTSAVGLQSVVATQKAVLLKQPVAMRHEFFTLPKTIGVWKQQYDEPSLPKEREDELGTEHYLTRVYRDTSKDENDPAAYGRVHIAYYTGMIDTVPHVPDRCWVSAGMTAGPLRDITLDLAPADRTDDADHGGYIIPTQLKDPITGSADTRMPATEISAKLFTAFDKEQPDRPINTAYFFIANGSYYASPNSVRLLGFDIRDRYSYYCKVEVMFGGVTDAALSEQRTEALLSALMPEVMACLPDWVDVKGGRWPAETAAGVPGG